MAELDDYASRHFRYRDLIEAGDTYARHQPDNTPQNPETWTWLARLAADILDPVADAFAAPEITYGFAGPNLVGYLDSAAAPDRDQHAGAETGADGAPICAVGGQAVDFYVPGQSSLAVAQFVVENHAFDHLHFFGPSRPIHVSLAPENRARVCLIFNHGRDNARPLWMPPRQFLRIKE